MYTFLSSPPPPPSSPFLNSLYISSPSILFFFFFWLIHDYQTVLRYFSIHSPPSPPGGGRRYTFRILGLSLFQTVWETMIEKKEEIHLSSKLFSLTTSISYTFQKKKTLSRLFLDENIHVCVYIYIFYQMYRCTRSNYKTEMYLLIIFSPLVGMLLENSSNVIVQRACFPKSCLSTNLPTFYPTP